VRKSNEEVVEDLLHVINYERHQRVISSTKKNLCKNLIMEFSICTLSISLFINTFLCNNLFSVLSIASSHYKHYSTHVYCSFSNHVDVVVLFIKYSISTIIARFVVVQIPTKDPQILSKYGKSYHYQLCKKSPQFNDGGGPP
jgi:hypothetical protein